MLLYCHNRNHSVALIATVFTSVVMLVVMFGCARAFAANENTSSINPATQLRREILPQYSLSAAVSTAVENYPTLRRSNALASRSSASVSLARTAYLPTFDLLAQELRTTTNNIAGSIFPQVLNVVPTQTGPANDTSTFKSKFANDFGFNLSWLLYDGGERHANVKVARSQVVRSNADVKLTELEIQTAAAEAYLQTVAAKQTILAQKATVDRMQAYNLVVHTLVDKGLRAGVDAARADADLSGAKIALVEAQREAELSAIDLAEAMGLAGRDIEVVSAPWVKQLQQPVVFTAAVPSDHPLAVLHASEIDTARAQVLSVKKSYHPRVWFHSGMWARGSGVRIDAHPVADGILPQNANYIAGFGIDFAALDYYAVKAKARMASQTEEVERANYDLAIQTLTQKDARARVLLRTARQLAEETPTLVSAAKENETKALERYRVGLSNVLEVAEAQRILQGAVVQDAVAQIRIWRAILATAYAHGDMRPFLELVRNAEASSK